MPDFEFPDIPTVEPPPAWEPPEDSPQPPPVSPVPATPVVRPRSARDEAVDRILPNAEDSYVVTLKYHARRAGSQSQHTSGIGPDIRHAQYMATRSNNNIGKVSNTG